MTITLDLQSNARQTIKKKKRMKEEEEAAKQPGGFGHKAMKLPSAVISGD